MSIEGSDGREPGVGTADHETGRRGDDRTGEMLSRLRHDLRNPVGQIIGYGELMIDDAEDEGRPEPLDVLRSIVEGGKELLDQIDRGLPACDEAGAHPEVDLAGLRLRLLGPVGRILAECDRLGRDADGPDRGGSAADVAKVRAAAIHLIELADGMLVSGGK